MQAVRTTGCRVQGAGCGVELRVRGAGCRVLEKDVSVVIATLYPEPGTLHPVVPRHPAPGTQHPAMYINRLRPRTIIL
jgi:hypothetical protein